MTIWLPTVEGPADLPDLRAWLLHEWRPGTALFDGFGESPWINRTLKAAALWWVEPGTCEVLAESAPSIPADLTLDLRDLPTPCGLAVLAVDLEGIDADPAWNVLRGKVRVSGIMWGPITIGISDTEVYEAISIGTFSRSIFRDDTVLSLEEMTIAYPTLAKIVDSNRYKWPDHGDLFAYLGRSDWLPGACPDTPLPGDILASSERTLASKAEDRRLIAALWALTRTTVVDVTTPPIPRSTVRRAKRAGLDPTVRVLSLGGTRTHRADSEPTGTSSREHHHSWIVSPHFRWQAHGPGRSERKLILVPSHLKGDPALPLLGADRVWRVLPPRGR